jgi:hypothetical protein
VISLGRFVVAGTGMGSSRLGETETPTNLGTTKIKYGDDIFSDSRTEAMLAQESDGWLPGGEEGWKNCFAGRERDTVKAILLRSFALLRLFFC